jgi:hypothetical protein
VPDFDGAPPASRYHPSMAWEPTRQAEAGPSRPTWQAETTDPA